MNGNPQMELKTKGGVIGKEVIGEEWAPCKGGIHQHNLARRLFSNSNVPSFQDRRRSAPSADRAALIDGMTGHDTQNLERMALPTLGQHQAHAHERAQKTKYGAVKCTRDMRPNSPYSTTWLGLSGENDQERSEMPK
jgi:hypothetical protein